MSLDFFIFLIIIIMPRKVKVLDIQQPAPEQPTNQEIEEPAPEQPVEQPASDNDSTKSFTSSSSVQPSEPATPQTKEASTEKVPCPHCGVLCLAKTLKYSHLKNCKNKPKPVVVEAEPLKVQIVKPKKLVREPPQKNKRVSNKKSVELQSQQQPTVVKHQPTKTEAKRAIYESLLTVKF